MQMRQPTPPGLPDDVVTKIAQNVAQHIIVKKYFLPWNKVAQ
jgi:hypothetical protein